jgi:putative membrane protein
VLPPLDLGTLVSESQLRLGWLVPVVLAAAGYLVLARRGGRPWWRTAAFLAGLAVVVLATNTGIEAYGGVLQWVHMIEHLMLIMVAPVLLSVGSPLQLVHDRLPARGRARLDAVLARPVVGWLTSPLAAAVAYAVAVVGVHLTGLLSVAMTGPDVHAVEELVYLVAGWLLFRLAFGVRPGPWQLSPLGRLALLAFVTPVDTVVGFVLLQTGTVATNLAHSAHSVANRPGWALSPAQDTVAAGTTMWIGGTGLMAAMMIVVGLAWLHGRSPAPAAPGWADRARAETFVAHTGSQADPDSDDALAAYNAYLARLAESEHPR